MKRTLPLLLALLLALSSCDSLQNIVEQHETSVYIPVQTQVTDPLFSWEEEEETDAEPVPPEDGPQEAPAPSTADPEPTEPAETDAPSETEAAETDEPAENAETDETAETEAAPENALSKGAGTTPWVSLTSGDDNGGEGVFTRAATALLAEQIVRCCVNRDWLKAGPEGMDAMDETAVSNFYITTLKYKDLSAYPSYFANLVARNENEGTYTVSSSKAEEISTRFFGGGNAASSSARYASDEEGFPVSYYDLTNLQISSDSVSTTARFHLTDTVREDPGAPLTDNGEYRIIFYRAEDGGLPRMLFAGVGKAEPEGTADPPMPERTVEEWPAPDFLTAEQKELWERAGVLASAFNAAGTFAESYPRKDGAPFVRGDLFASSDGWFACRGRWTNYYDFESMMASVFSWNYWQELKEGVYRNENGRLWASTTFLPSLEGHLASLDRYELISSNDWTVDFWYDASYQTDPGVDGAPLVTYRYRITYVNSDLGWRISSFAVPGSGYLKGGVPAAERETTRTITENGAVLLTEQIVRWVMPAAWMEGTPVFTNEDALRFLYSLTLYAGEAPEHPYIRYVKRVDERSRFEIAEADAREIARELFGIDNLKIPDGAFDAVAGCVWVPINANLPRTPYDLAERSVGDGGEVVLAHVVAEDLAAENWDFGEWNFVFRRNAFGSPLFSMTREG